VALVATALELRSGNFANSRFTRLSVASPAAERRAGVFVLDRAPETAGAFELSALGGGDGENPDAEDAAGAVAKLLCEFEGGAGAIHRLLDAARLRGELRELGEHSGLPPQHADLTGEFCALCDQRVSAVLVSGIAHDRSERSDGLGHAPPVVVSLVDCVACLDRARTTLDVNVYPEDVAEAIAYFATSRSGKSTGDILNVDDGVRAAYPR
jgi:hypothetical protein